jgi:hypothetical protein
MSRKNVKLLLTLKWVKVVRFLLRYDEEKKEAKKSFCCFNNSSRRDDTEIPSTSTSHNGGRLSNTTLLIGPERLFAVKAGTAILSGSCVTRDFVVSAPDIYRSPY